jgi:twitching motility protein PilT
MLDLDRLLRLAIDERASDVHVKVGARPFLRVDGALRETQLEIVEAADTEGVVDRLLVPARAESFRETADADVVYGPPGLGRFRVSVFRQRGQVGLVLRRIVPGVPGLDALGLPPAAIELASAPSGLVLVSGLAGSGRTTTLAAMVDHVNQHAARHIVTVEDPVEVAHADKQSIVNQREVGTDTPSYRDALEHVLRRDPDVVATGALPDQESALCALEVADAGGLVFAVGLAVGAVDAVTRLVGMFPPERQTAVRTLLARTLRGVLCQRLVPRAGGRGRVPAVEVLIANSPVAEALLDADRSARLEALVADGEFWGMQTFDQSIAALYRRGLVEREAALAHALYAPGLRIAIETADRERAGVAAAPIPITSATPASSPG